MTALAMVLTLGPWNGFGRGKRGQLLGLIPSQHSSGGRSSWDGSASRAVPFRVSAGGKRASRRRYDAELGRFYRRLAVRKIADWPVAVARKLATRLYLMLREDWTRNCAGRWQVSPSHSVVAKQTPTA